jgi:hypothetical protein
LVTAVLLVVVGPAGLTTTNSTAIIGHPHAHHQELQQLHQPLAD